MNFPSVWQTLTVYISIVASPEHALKGPESSSETKCHKCMLFPSQILIDIRKDSRYYAEYNVRYSKETKTCVMVLPSSITSMNKTPVNGKNISLTPE